MTVIIPAHNEEAVIGRTLAALTGDAAPGELDVIIVCNGCHDRTADVAHAYGSPVHVIETGIGSKSHALNLGDKAAGSFPRFYVDADVGLSTDSLRKVAKALADGALAAAPRPVLRLSESSWAVRAYYAIDTRLPWFREGIGNAGVYALSEFGRSRFKEFPAITTDDGFVRLQFAPHERCTVADAEAIITAPATLSGLVAIKTRSHFGKLEMIHHFPHLLENAGPGNRSALLRLCGDPRNWPALAVYTYVKLAARLRSRRMYDLEGGNRWERDDSRPAVSNHGDKAPRGA